MYDNSEMFKKYRFTREGVQHIIQIMEGGLEHATKRSHTLPAHLQVYVVLGFFATGSVLDSSATIHGCSIATMSRVVRRVTQLLCKKKRWSKYSNFFVTSTFLKSSILHMPWQVALGRCNSKPSNIFLSLCLPSLCYSLVILIQNHKF